MIASTGAQEAIPLVEERLTVSVDGQHATTTLLQVFQHGNGAQIEGRYKLRPGMGSRVEGFSYWNGEQKIVGEVFERTTARQVYDNVTSRRRDPGLLEEDGEGAFQFKVFPIQPNEKKRVELRWSKWLERRGQTVRFRAPITRGNADIVIDVQGQVKNVRSSSHKLKLDRDSNGIRLRSDGARGRGELVIEWEVDEPEWLPSAYVHRGSGDNDGWFALSLATNDVDSTRSVAAKDVTIVIDRSGSMTGEPLANAKAAAVDVIRRLPPTDRVNVVAFSDEVDPLFRAPQLLDEENRNRAIGFVQRLHEGGGTDIALALTTAIKSQDTKLGRPRVVVFMTDGQSDVDKSILAAKADTGDIRLFTVGLGKDVNRPLLQRLAALKRGNFTYIEKASAIQADVAKLATHIAKPLLVDVSLDVDGVQATRLYPRSLPDLFVDDQLVVSGRLKSASGIAKFTIKGRLAGKPVTFTRTIDLGKSPPRPWVGRLWAQARVDHLQEEIALGAKQPELMTELIELALAYNFVTPYTAFLAIPEAELGDQRGTIEAARAAKKKIMAQNPDAANLDKNAADPVYLSQDHAQNLPQGAPAMRTMGNASDEDVAERSFSGSVQTQRGRGCAGCSTGGDASSLLLLLGLVVLVLRRRRVT
ncbi:MAG: VWA domain-containing protein [Deltaproteobacteria bacterium]|nr:VWA domain-containing protein [Deltaproteobacteria bacterium]